MAKDKSPTVDAVALVDDLIRRAFDRRASDIHLEPADDALRIRFRIDGVLCDEPSLPLPLAANLVARLKVLAGLLTYRTDIPQEGSVAATQWGHSGDIRVATFPTVRGERAVLRLMAVAHVLRDLDQLGHADDTVARLRDCLDAAQGLIVVCGPAGSGKTTTLAAAIAHVQAQRPGASIITVEDPVEIRLDGVTQVQVESARGLTYPVVLRSLLRQDPQVLMIGEIRDAETAHIAVEAALTGHLLLTTLHSGTPTGAMVRLREMGVPAYQLTSTLLAVLSQRLLRTTSAGADDLAGRAAIGELAVMTPELRQALLDDADEQSLSQIVGGRCLRDDAERLLAAGRTSHEEINRVLGPPGR